MIKILKLFVVIMTSFLFLYCDSDDESISVSGASVDTTGEITDITEENTSTESGSSNTNQKVYIIGTAVTEKCTYPDCPTEKVVLWDLAGQMTILDSSITSVSQATSYNGSLYIAGDFDTYWVIDPQQVVTEYKLTLPSNYVASSLELTGISVNSKGVVAVSGVASKKVNKKKVLVYGYWKNGELTEIPVENSDYEASKIGLDTKGNAYITGWKMKSHTVIFASYWLNGKRKDLTSTLDGETTDVAIGAETESGAHVYFSGAHGSYNGGSLATYWRRKPSGQTNQTKVTKVKTAGLPKNMVWTSLATSIHVEGSTVYMAGVVNVINAGDVPVYWKNKVQHELPVDFDYETCDYCRVEPKDITTYDGNVLVAGDYYDANEKVDHYYTHGERKAVYWLNKKKHSLCESCGSSYVFSIILMN